MKVRRDVI